MPELPPAVARLSEIVDAGIYDPTVGQNHFFGEDCVLLSAAREALTTKAGGAFRAACQKLLEPKKDVFHQIYGAGEHDKLVWDQGKHLLHGLTEAVLAACSPSEDVDWGRVKKAVAEFDAAWPPGPSPPKYAVRCSGTLARYCQEVGPIQTTGFWVVWDILDDLVPEYTYPSGESRPEVKTAGLPILLFGEKGLSQVATLTVDLVFDGGHGFRPDPLGLGLTALWPQGDDNFLEAMGNAWRVAGLPQSCRGRWKITTFRPPDKELGEGERLATPYLAGRSAEAAACCAIWAAWGGVPADPARERIELDPQGTVTATLEGGPGKLATLGPVQGVPGKLEAARKADLQLVVVSTAQPPEDFEDHRAVRPDDPVLVETIEDAFETLLSYHQILGDYQASVKAKWLEPWEPGTADVLDQG